jgi:hypothetical protein
MDQPTTTKRSDDSYWAKPVQRLDPKDADAANVRGRRLNAAAGGFGWLYQKTFRVRLIGADATPRQVVAIWKERFGEFWGKGRRQMSLPASGIAPGEIGLISDRATVPVAPAVHTGILVIYADEESFSFMSPEGHPFAGPLTLSAYADDDGTTVIQAQEFTRASDPFYELMMHMPFLGERMQNEIWRTTLGNLARHFGVDAPVEATITVVDRRWQWRYAKNLWHNAGIRSTLSAPVRWLRPRGRRPAASAREQASR